MRSGSGVSMYTLILSHRQHKKLNKKWKQKKTDDLEKSDIYDPGIRNCSRWMGDGHIHVLKFGVLVANLCLIQQDRKRPDGTTLLPWARGKPITWDVTVPDTCWVAHRPDCQRSMFSGKQGSSKQDCKVWCSDVKTVFLAKPVTVLWKPVFYRLPDCVTSHVTFLICGLRRNVTYL